MTDIEMKKKIFNAAQKVFDEKGFYEASLDEISESAEISVKEVKELYPSKERIFNEIMSEGIDVITQFLHKIINERGKADAKITKIIREILKKYEEYYPLFKLISINMESVNQEEMAIKGVLEQEKIEKYRQNTAVIGRIISKGQIEGVFSDCNPLEAAYMLRGMIVSAVKYWQATGKTQPLENYTDSITKIFFKGISK